MIHADAKYTECKNAVEAKMAEIQLLLNAHAKDQVNHKLVGRQSAT